MNILITGRIEIPPPYGGMARRILNNCKVWTGENHKVCLLYHSKKKEVDLMGADKVKIYFVYPFDMLRALRQKQFLPYFFKHPFSLLQFTQLIVNHLEIAWEIFKIFRNFSFKRYNLIIFHYWNYAQKLIEIIQKERIHIIEAHYGFESTLVSEIVADRLNIPVIISSYAEAVYWREKGEEKAEKYAPLFDITYNRAKKVIAPSWHCAKGPLRFVSRNKVEVIYSSIDVYQYEEYLKKEKEIKKEMGFKKEERIVLFVGMLDPRKGPQFLAKAAPYIFQKMPNTKIVFIGSDLGFKKKLETLVKNIRERVIFTGGISDELLRKYYTVCDVLAFPSITERECMGMSMKEAMACGKPVVGFSVGGIPEAIIDGETGYLVQPRNEKMLAEKIIKVLKGNERWRMKNACIKRAKELFDIEISARKEEEVLKECIAYSKTP